MAFAALATVGCQSKVSVQVAASGFGSAQQVLLAIDGVDLLDSGAASHEVDSKADASVNVLDYVDGSTYSLIDSDKLKKGTYTGLRLRFGDTGSAVYASDGSQSPIDTGNAITYADADFTLGKNDHDQLLVVLETRFSLVPSATVSGHYTLTPVLRVMDPKSAGSVAGNVLAELVTSSACTQGRSPGAGVAIYAFSGSGVTPQDYVQDVSSSPVAAEDIVVSADAASFSYLFPFLAAGSYTLALTCNADSDNPATSDGLKFLATAAVTITANQSMTVNLGQ